MTGENGQEVVKKGSMMKMVLIGVFLIVLGGGGFFGYKFFVEGNAAGPGNAAKDAEKVKMNYPLKSFIVNLIDKGGMGKRYLKVTMELEIGGPEDKELLDRHASQIRDSILLLLSSKSFGDVNSIEGKVQLKHSLVKRINEALSGSTVTKIFFTEFVVQ